MIDLWREWLYPLGFLSGLAFSARMLLQWLKSEQQGRSVVMPAFWKLSLAGNLLLLMHALIQIQFHVAFVQVCNAVISWRNLNLMRPQQAQASTRKTIAIMLASCLFVLGTFFFQDVFLLNGNAEWFRIPTAPWQAHTEKNIALFWHLLGFMGLILFGSRFWFQWWWIEKYKISYLSSTFWWLSLLGESLCLIYFVRIKDPVNYMGPLFALIPYLRNLALIYRKREQEPSLGP